MTVSLGSKRLLALPWFGWVATDYKEACAVRPYPSGLVNLSRWSSLKERLKIYMTETHISNRIYGYS